MPFMYILECSDGTYYTGSTKDLQKRLWEHRNGYGANHTKNRLPVKLVYFEQYSRVDDAFYREKQIQGWGHEKKKSLIQRNYLETHTLAECKNKSHFKIFKLAHSVAERSRSHRHVTCSLSVTESSEGTSPENHLMES